MMRVERIKLLGRLAAYVSFACGMLILISLPSSKYGWMHELDPSTSTSEIEDGSGNRAIVILVLVVATILPQIAIVMTTKSSSERLISLGLVLLAALIWMLSR